MKPETTNVNCQGIPTNTRLRNIWHKIKERCQDPRHPQYKRYGGQGVRVCTWWETYENFYVWAMQNGYDKTLTIDRIDNKLGYTPENCRWVSRQEQARNRKNNIMITFNGKTKCLAEWAEITGFQDQLLEFRYHNGYTPEQILLLPSKGKQKFSKLLHDLLSESKQADAYRKLIDKIDKICELPSRALHASDSGYIPRWKAIDEIKQEIARAALDAKE